MGRVHAAGLGWVAVAGVVLMSAFRSAARVANYDLPFVDWMVGDIFINQSKIGAITAPILLLHGQYDDVVAVSHSKVGRSACLARLWASWLAPPAEADVCPRRRACGARFQDLATRCHGQNKLVILPCGHNDILASCGQQFHTELKTFLDGLEARPQPAKI